jgi:hypothetical protein
MLLIRAEQMRVFEADQQDVYEAKLSGYLAGKYGINQNDCLRAMVHRGVSKAEQYGLITEQGAATFLELMVEEGENFEDDPARPVAREILTDSDLPEPFKLDMLTRTRPWSPPAPEELMEDPE